MPIKRDNDDSIFELDGKSISNKLTVGALKELLSYFPDDSEILLHDILTGTTSLATGLITAANPDDRDKVMPYITFNMKNNFNLFDEFEKVPFIRYDKIVEGSTTIEIAMEESICKTIPDYLKNILNDLNLHPAHDALEQSVDLLKDEIDSKIVEVE